LLSANLQLAMQRRRRGWSQADLSHRLRRLAEEHGVVDIAVDGNMVSRWERGIRRPSPRYIRLLCQLFDLDGPALGFADDDQAGSHSISPEIQARFSIEEVPGARPQPPTDEVGREVDC
jgi:transcriptional regulator with XRE-family HTH domain